MRERDNVIDCLEEISEYRNPTFTDHEAISEDELTQPDEVPRHVAAFPDATPSAFKLNR